MAQQGGGGGGGGGGAAQRLSFGGTPLKFNIYRGGVLGGGGFGGALDGGLADDALFDPFGGDAGLAGGVGIGIDPSVSLFVFEGGGGRRAQDVF